MLWPKRWVLIRPSQCGLGVGRGHNSCHSDSQEKSAGRRRGLGKSFPTPGESSTGRSISFSVSESRNTWNEGSQRGIVTRDLLGMAEDDGEDEDSR